MMNNNIPLTTWNVRLCLNQPPSGVTNNPFLDGIIIFSFSAMLSAYAIDVAPGKAWAEENYRIYKDYITYIKNHLITCYIVIKKYYCKHDSRTARTYMNCSLN